MWKVRSSALSDVGRARRVNEDFYAIDAERKLYLVADGMGGHGHGEVASRVAIGAIRDFFDRAAASRRRFARRRRRNADEQADRLREAIDRANSTVLRSVEEDGTLAGMGTTLVALQLAGDGALVAHVGDSRAYRLRDGRLKRLTSDHTWVNEQVSAGNISETQALSHPFKSVVTRALGGDQVVEVEVRECDLVPGDLFMLCSDGLTTMVPEDEIERRLSAGEPLETTCRRLVDEANARGGRDNVTVLLLAVDEPPH